MQGMEYFDAEEGVVQGEWDVGGRACDEVEGCVEAQYVKSTKDTQTELK